MHLAIPISLKLLLAGYTVCFERMSNLVRLLKTGELQRASAFRMNRILRSHVLVIDEIMSIAMLHRLLHHAHIYSMYGYSYRVAISRSHVGWNITFHPDTWQDTMCPGLVETICQVVKTNCHFHVAGVAYIQLCVNFAGRRRAPSSGAPDGGIGETARKGDRRVNHDEPGTGRHDVRGHGAMGDGVTLDSGAIQRAIDAAAAAGGGTVVLPPGRYRCGALELKTGVRLCLEHAAVLQGSDRLEDYRVGEKLRGLLFAQGAADIAIDGEGVIDGAGLGFHTPDRVHFKPDFEREPTRQGVSFMTRAEDLVHGPFDFDRRASTMITLLDCTRVTLRGVTIRDSPEWATRIARCRHVNIHDLVIDNDLNVPNSDGIHVTACQNVRISHCDISAGDDAIAITTVAGQTRMAADCPADRQVTENVVVSDCILRSRSAAVRIGYGPWPVRRITLSNLVIHGSNRGIGVFTRNGGSVSDVLCQNIVIETDLVTGHWWGKAEPIHISAVRGEIRDGAPSPGVIENVRFSQITARSPAGCVVLGESPGLVRDIALDRVSLRIVPSACQQAYGGNFDLRPIDDFQRAIFAHDIPALWCEHAERMSIHGLQVRWADGLAPWYTYAVHACDCDELEIDALRGAAARADLEPIMLERCQAATVRRMETVASDPVTGAGSS